MAELLVRAKPYWMDSLTKKEVDKMSESEKQTYEARSQIGDIICVYPDGTCKEEPAPNSVYAIVKIPGLSYRDAKDKYEQHLSELIKDKDGKITDYKVLRYRKYSLPDTDIKAIALTTSKVATLTKVSMESSVITKTATAVSIG